ncbi:MAG: O-antigen ligase domain-containing protein [Dehalococcoidia bacterium]|nr:MAG: O-antigen ligase domain-containing protein [Dehalococcoidia bacterium]
MNLPDQALRFASRPGHLGPRGMATVAVALLVLPVAFIAAATPARYSLALVAIAAVPVAGVIAMRSSMGVLLTFAFVAPPLVQFLVKGSPDGIPVAAVLPIVGVELVLLLRGLSSLRDARPLGPVEAIFVGAMLYAAAIGLAGVGDRRVWLGEFIETTNLVVMLWLLRLNRVRFTDLRSFVLAGHIMAAPFFVWYVMTRFGQYRLDFFFGLTTTLVPITVAMLVHTRVSLALRAALLLSCFVMLVATAAAGIRGTTMIAVLGTGLVVFFSLRRFSGLTLTVSASAVFVLLLLQPVFMRVASQAAPEAVERFQSVSDSPTLSVRLLEAQDAFTAFRSRPMGHGLGAILVTRHEIVWGATGVTVEYGPTTFVHNSYAWYLAKTGVVGFAALMLIMATAVIEAIRRLPTTRGSAGLALALLLAFLAGAWGGPALHNVFYTPILAFAIHLARQRDAATPDEDVAAPLPDRTHALHGAAR